MSPKILGLLLTTSLVALASQSQAQVSDPAAQSVEAKAKAAENASRVDEIVVTGTRIVRPNTQSAAPITSVTTEEIKSQAAVNIEDILNRLPQIAPDSQQNYQDSDGRQRIKLRNLGFERTLVLVDGKRLGTMNGEDANMIPPSLVKRIDILSGGASSVYGSDAIAGVVNFIMDDDFEGVQLDANYSFYNHKNKSNVVTKTAATYGFDIPNGTVNDGVRKDIALTLGKHFFDDALKVSGFVDYRTADLVPYSARSISACQLLESTKDGPLSCTNSTYSANGYLSPRGGSNNNSVYINNPDGTRTFVPYSVAAGTATNPYDGYSYQRASKRWNAGGSASLKFSDAAELYSSAMYSRDESTNRFPARVFSYTAYGSTPYSVNCNNPLMSTTQATSICGSAAGTSTMMPLDVRYRFKNLPYALDTYVNEGLRVTGGLRGVLGNVWHYDVGGVYARNTQDTSTGAYADYDKVNKSLNAVNVNGVATCAAKVSGVDPACVPFDAFKAGNNDQALYNYLFTGTDGSTTTKGTLYDGLATVSGDLGEYGITSPWAKDGVAVSAGLEYRKDSFDSTADATYRSQNGGADQHFKQSVWEGNVEAQAPLIQDRAFAHLLQVNAGYRESKYSTNPEKFATWKLEGLYAPIEDITFRGAYNKAQRAPTVIEIAQATSIGFGKQGGSENDFCAGVPTQVPDPNDPTGTKTITVITPPKASLAVCKATGLSEALYGSATLSCPDSACTVRTGGFTVDPETAHTTTVGVVLRPRFIPGFTASIDRYIINIDDAIGYNDYSYYVNGCLQSALQYFCQYIKRDPTTGKLYSAASTNPTSGFISQGTSNAYKVKSQGWDFQAQYILRTETIGKFEWLFNGSLSTRQSSQASPIQAEVNCVGYYGNCGGQLVPEWSHGLRTTYTTPNDMLSVSLNWRYISELTNTSNSGKVLLGYTADGVRTTYYRIPAYNYFDLSMAYKLNERVKLRLAANNLLDKDPPILPNSYNISLARNNTAPQRYDSLGRNIAISASLKY